jgi:hypothetical protein
METNKYLYHPKSEQDIDLIKFRINETENEIKEHEKNNSATWINPIPYQTLLHFFYDIKSIIND